MVAEIYARTKRHRGRLARPEGIQPGSSDIHWRRRTRWCHSQGSRRSEPRACGRSVGQAANLCLGFTFICSKSRKGRFLIIRKTRRDRMMAKLLELKEEMRRRMHWPISEQGEWLKQVVGGFFNYHAVPTNSRALAAFRHHVRVLWGRTLRRRSQKDRTTWDRIAQLAEEWLPKPRILHPWPNVRFAVKHPR